MENFIISNGIPLHVSITGKGEKTILFLHGFLENMNIRDEFSKELENEYKIIKIDLPGHALSGSHPEENSMEFCADVLMDLIKYAKSEKVILAGHSMGGYIALNFANKYPNNTESLILLNSSPFADSDEKRADRLREIEVIKSGKLQTICSISIPKMFAEFNLKSYSDHVDELLELCELHDDYSIIAVIRGLMSRPDMTQFLKETTIPTLLLFGDNDRFMPLERVEGLIALLNNKKARILEKTGHICFVERREETLSVIKSFLSELP